MVVVGGWVGGWYLDYSVSSGPFLRFSMRFEFLSEMLDHSVCETRDPSFTICPKKWASAQVNFSTENFWGIRAQKFQWDATTLGFTIT